MSKKYNAISLFTGAGGMDIGFERAGIKTILANELMHQTNLRRQSIKNKPHLRGFFFGGVSLEGAR